MPAHLAWAEYRKRNGVSQHDAVYTPEETLGHLVAINRLYWLTTDKEDQKALLHAADWLVRALRNEGKHKFGRVRLVNSHYDQVFDFPDYKTASEVFDYAKEECAKNGPMGHEMRVKQAALFAYPGSWTDETGIEHIFFGDVNLSQLALHADKAKEGAMIFIQEFFSKPQPKADPHPKPEAEDEPERKRQRADNDDDSKPDAQ